MMNENAQIIIALGVATASIISAVFAGIGVLVSSRNSRKLDEVHRLTNSLADRSNTAERAAGMAEGELKGRDHVANLAAAIPTVVHIVDASGVPVGSPSNPMAVVTPPIKK